MGIPHMGAAMGIAFGAPEIISGVKKAKVDVKKVKVEGNPYDAMLGNQKPIAPLASFESSSAFEKEAEEGERNYLKEYGIPAAFLATTLIRGKQTGNYMQFPKKDIPAAFRKVMPGVIDRTIARRAKTSNGWQRTALQGMERYNKDTKKTGGGTGKILTDAILMGAGLSGGGMAAEYLAKKEQQVKQQSMPKKASFEKSSAEIPRTAANRLRKIIREGMLQPAISAVPIYVAPVAVSFAINKDVKTDFQPVRKLTKAEKERRSRDPDSSQTHFSSRNNAVLNAELTKTAGLSSILKERAWKKSWDKAYFKAGEKEPIRIKDWKEYFVEDLPLAGPKSVMMAVPITALAVSDPVQKMKQQIQSDAKRRDAERAQKEQQKALKKIVRKEVKKVLE